MNLNMTEPDSTAHRRIGIRCHLRRWIFVTLMALYCLAIFFALDFLYSNLFFSESPNAPGLRIPNAVFDHTLAANYEGYERWGEARYRIATNSLGFKDATMRYVAPRGNSRRVVLIGDSLTEGIGVPFEQSFAGMLALAGQQRRDKTEFLNAAVVSYSPTLYYRKIKFLLDSGLKFDELVVLPDLSDVQDEATSYFCSDDNPKYAALCRPESTYQPVRYEKPHEPHGVLSRNFRLSNALLRQLWVLRGGAKGEATTPSDRIGWSVPNFDVGNMYAPLGVEGGITRAVQHMQALAELLKRQNIPLTVVVYPWPLSLVQDDPGGRWVTIWRDFCAINCKAFINTFPDFIAAKDAHSDWYVRYFILGDIHFSLAGHKLVFDALKRNGL